MRRFLTAFALLTVCLSWAEPVRAFCGFFVAKADTRLFNEASKVALVRDGDRTAMTMANDFRGELKEFAIVVPVPTFIRRDQIKVADQALLDHLDAYSAPRLVEYFDADPCKEMVMGMARSGAVPAPMAAGAAREKALGVTVEARYTVGEYDILILSARESGGLETWLRENGYRIPEGASRVLGSYIKQGMRFFVARVNLAEQAKLGFTFLRPLQVSYESPKFMLPIRLGTVNADGAQELFVFAVTRKGRVETTNYRTVKLPSGSEVPPYVKQDFAGFYQAMFKEQVRREDMRAVFLEYAWDMNWCDPCAADPLSREELAALGVSWLDEAPQQIGSTPPPVPLRPGRPLPGIVPPGQAVDAFITRLHVRYDGERFPEDLVFQETGNRETFQGRYVLRHPWKGTASCAAADEYRRSLRQRQEREAQTLATLTGWDVNEIRKQAIEGTKVSEDTRPRSWWQRLWD
jgi:hypothetical protein